MVDTFPFAHNGIQAAVKYNPHLWGAKELKSIFVVRNRELKKLVEQVNAVPQDAVPQHLLLIGLRGMGKTTLLQRVAVAVEEDPELNQFWLPLRFPEEQYTVSTLAELWGNVLSSLADALEKRSLNFTAIDNELRLLETMAPEQERADRTLNYLNQWCQHNQKRLLLLIDSTDLLFDNLCQSSKGRKASKRDEAQDDSKLWALRGVLQSNPNLFWLGASYRALEAAEHYNGAFLDFFQVHELKPLKLEEIQQAMQALARTFGTGRGLQGEEAEAEITRAFTSKPERLKTLHRLTGGNPRTTVMLFELFAAGGSDHVRNDLERLLDMMTPLYKSRLEALAEQPRKVLAHVMESWHPVGSGDLVRISGLKPGTVSSQLERLQKEGLIEKAALPNTTISGYQVAERFFNIWYLMRNSVRRLKLRLQWLVEFMRLWYSPDDLQHMARLRSATASLSRCAYDELEFSRAIAYALPEAHPDRLHLEFTIFKARQHQLDVLQDMFDFDGEDKVIQNVQEYEQRLDALQEKLKQLPIEGTTEEKQEFCASVMTLIGISIDKKEEMVGKALVEQDCSHLKEVIDSENSQLKEVDKEALSSFKELVLQGEFYIDLPVKEIALIQLRKELLKLTEFYYGYLILLWNKYQDEGVDELIRLGWATHAVDDLEKCWPAIENLILQRKESQAIKNGLDELINKYFTTKNKNRMFNLGNFLYLSLQAFDQAVECYRKAIQIDENYTHAWNDLGNLLQDHLNRPQEAEACYRKAIQIDEKYTHAWNGLGTLLQDHLNRPQEAEVCYRKAIQIDENYTHAWNGLGDLLQIHLNRPQDAEACYRKAIQINENDTLAWNNLGILLKNHLNRPQEAEACYRKAIQIDEKNANAWNGLANLLWEHLHRLDDAEAAYLKAIEMDSNERYLFANLARLYAFQNKPKQATEQYRKAIQCQTTKNTNAVLMQAHLWLGNRDMAYQALTQLARDAEAGNKWRFYQIKEQCWECQQIGRGLELAELMKENELAEFLRPFELALRKVNGDSETIKGAPVEIQNVAEEVAEDIQQYLRRFERKALPQAEFTTPPIPS